MISQFKQLEAETSREEWYQNQVKARIAAGDRLFQGEETRRLLAESEARLAAARPKLDAINSELRARKILPPVVSIRKAINDWEEPLTKDWVQKVVADLIADPWAYDPTGGPARAIARKLAGTKSRTPELYRGMAWDNSPEAAAFISRANPGDVIDFGVTSFSASQKVAEDFLHPGFFREGLSALDKPIPSNSVLLHIAPGLPGFNASEHSEYSDMKEWITRGKLRVVRVVKADNWARVPGVYHVYLEPA